MGSEFIRLSHTSTVVGKKNLLYTELEMLNILKSLKEYKKLRKQEYELKVSLKSKIQQVIDYIKELERRLPETSIKIKTLHSTSPKISPKTSQDKEKRISFDDEIYDIKKKLEKLQA